MSFQTENTLFDAAIESARVFNSTVVSCAATSGLLEAMQEFALANEIARRAGCKPEKFESFVCFLDVLFDEGILERISANGQTFYRARTRLDRQHLVKGAGAALRNVKSDVLEPWFGDGHVNRIRDLNTKFLGRNLSYFFQSEKQREFGGDYLSTWKMNLTNPLYEFGRLLAVRELSKCGTRFLDLACGLGYGTERLAQMVRGASILGVDKSTDMLREARAAIYPGAKVKFIQRDLNTGLPPIAPNSIDGILFNGAFHFIHDKRTRLQEMAASLRLGGLLVIGHCFCQSGFSDESMHRFYFSTLSDRSYLITFEELRGLLSETGFKPYKEYHRGSHSYLIAERIGRTDLSP
jgi:SAM-dependent methyltransferase